MNLRELILNSKLKQKTIIIPEWDNAKVTVRELSAGELEQVNDVFKDKGPVASQAQVLVFATLDSDGSQLFQPGDAEALVNASNNAVNKMYLKIIELSGIDAKKIKDSQTKSEPTTG